LETIVCSLALSLSKKGASQGVSSMIGFWSANGGFCASVSQIRLNVFCDTVLKTRPFSPQNPSIDDTP
jgi:hypothetical protein